MFSHDSAGQVPFKNYEKEWKAVQLQIDKRLPASALAEVKKIYALAKKEKQEAQVIKALSYELLLQQETREENFLATIKEVEANLKSSPEPARSILSSLEADLYLGYFQEHRWQLYDRTPTSYTPSDIATWSAEQLHDKIGSLYLASLKDPALLQKSTPAGFQAIIYKGNVGHLRPTLYDLLAHRALDYFKNDERSIAKPAYAFEISMASAFDPAADFIHRKFETKDSASLQFQALLIYQQLIAFHLNDKQPDALIDVDLERIQFVYSNSVHPDKETWYYNSINHVAHQYENLPAASQAWYLVAAYHEKNAATYSPTGDTTHRYDRIKARTILEKILSQKDSSEGKVNAFNLLNNLNQSTLSFDLEKINLPDQPFRSLVSYRNIAGINLRLVKATALLKTKLKDIYNGESWQAILAAPAIRIWQQPLPLTNDLQEHHAEIKIDALPAGEYILIAGNGEKMSDPKLVVGARLFYVSSISFVNRGQDFFVLNRDNGQPLSGATIQAWKENYDYATHKYNTVKAGTYTADASGHFKVENPKRNEKDYYRNNDLRLEITYNKEKFFPDESLSNNNYQRVPDAETPSKAEVFLFMDRALYRPGQTVYFKGISLKKTARSKAEILTGYQTVVSLQDANGQVVDSMAVTSNEFGSFNGRFTLPSSGLTGQFRLIIKDIRSQDFQVEEYKRPKYEVSFEPLKGTYKVNEKITVNGIAKAYAGNPIDGANASYRVVRQPRFMYPWLFRGWFPPSEPMEIAHGETKTDAAGRFSISFDAIPDLKVDTKLDPVFDYEITVDVTDAAGETRSADQTVTAGYKSLFLKNNIPATLPADSLHTLDIRAENSNGERQSTTARVTITRLMAETRLIRQRYWQRPDQFVMSREMYIQAFPNDEYDNELDWSTWKKGEIAFQQTDSLKTNAPFPLGDTKFKPGKYLVEIVTNDKDGNEVKDIKYLDLSDPNTAPAGYLWTEASDPIQPGEKTSVKLGTAADNVFVVQQTERLSPDSVNAALVSSFTVFNLVRGKKTIDIHAEEKDRGGFGLSWVFVKNNRIYTWSQTVQVPWENKNLKIGYTSFRDKTLPGSTELWKLKVSGHNNEAVAAEMLASMYDASLDQFYPFNWSLPNIWDNYYAQGFWNGSQNFSSVRSDQRFGTGITYRLLEKNYDYISFGFPSDQTDNGRGIIKQEGLAATPMVMRDANMSIKGFTAGQGNRQVAMDEKMKMVTDSTAIAHESINPPTNTPSSGEVQIRKNFNETAFFFPALRTDKDGNIEFSFTLPDALTRWKFQAISHTRDLALGLSSREIVTQKQLMVQPNPTRFLRQGDKMEFSSKVVNLTAAEITGMAQLQLFDASTNEPVDGQFMNVIPQQFFTIAAGQSEVIRFPIEIPYQFTDALVWRIVATAGEYSDGEENILPVLTNRALVTESLPLSTNGLGTSDFKFEKLLNSGRSETLTNQSLTVEYTSNPVWLAVQALPYLMEYPYDCAEQSWNRFYSNALASMLANSSPKLKAVFDKWAAAKGMDSASLISNLMKNQELKSVMAEETPWLLQAKTETEQRKHIALLFNLSRMTQELGKSIDQLEQKQSSNGGFVWFTGGPDDRYITQYIVSGIGHLYKLKAVPLSQQARLQSILNKALPYLDRKIREDYERLVKNKSDLKKYGPGSNEIYYLYMRSFFPDYPVNKASLTAYNYFMGRLASSWKDQSKYMQGMIALVLNRRGDKATATAILKSLKETSISNTGLGRYWKDAQRGWFWYQAPLERQALLIEAFAEISNDQSTIDELKTWLIRNKQTNNWESTRATAEACFALLMQGSSWINNNNSVQIRLGNTPIVPTAGELEAGTGYFKEKVEGDKVRPEMGNIKVITSNPSGTVTQPGWGAVYWQYFEDLDKISTASTPLSLVKKLFVQKNTDRGPQLIPVNEGDILKVGDKIIVRIELRVDREMEYVHMKDMRAAALEPTNVISSYKYQNGLGYYESTRDASTNFFFNNLQKGTYVFEYNLFVTNTGNFSNGITTIQCMYAPEFTAHSEGVRIMVE
ncbi:MAG: MG2 domain-containing protein [Chitinophagaceae bacterium]